MANLSSSIIKIYGVILLKNEKCVRSVNIEQLRPLTAEICYNIPGKCDCLRNMAVDLVLCLRLVSRNYVTLFTFRRSTVDTTAANGATQPYEKLLRVSVLDWNVHNEWTTKKHNWTQKLFASIVTDGWNKKQWLWLNGKNCTLPLDSGGVLVSYVTVTRKLPFKRRTRVGPLVGRVFI